MRSFMLALSVSVFLACLVGKEASAADRPNAISLEILGRGGLYSFNYDHMVTPDIAVGGGLSHYSLSGSGSSASLWIIPVYGNYYFMEGNSRPFATAGADIIVAIVVFSSVPLLTCLLETVQACGLV